MMRGSPIREVGKSSSERIASMSVTKEKGETESVHSGRNAATECKGRHNVPGAQQPQAHVNGEIVTGGHNNLAY